MEFVPKHFDAPLYFESKNFRLETLRSELANIDYEAVMSSKIRLRSVFAASTHWPRDTMTLSENKVDLTRHYQEFISREAFAYSVLSLDRKNCLGCVYINPSEVRKYDCETYLWVKDECIELDSELYATIRHWLKQTWPFANVCYPGRDISWEEWENIQNNS